MADINDLDKDLNKIKNKLQKTEKNVINKIDQVITKSVKDRWLKGLGVEEDGDPAKPLKSLKKSTIKQREYKKKKGKLSNLTDTNTSNLIDSGKTFKQFKSKKDKNSIEIGVLGDRGKIIEYNQDDRPLLNLSKEEVEKIDEILNKELDELFKDL